jgi:hypothetical protein
MHGGSVAVHDFKDYLTAAAKTALRSPRRREQQMSKTHSGRIFKGTAAAALAVAVSLAATASGFAATRHAVRAAQPRTPVYYNYVPGQIDAPGLTAGQLGRRTDPVLVAPGGYGPPDPASCGGFHC